MYTIKRIDTETKIDKKCNDKQTESKNSDDIYFYLQFVGDGDSKNLLLLKGPSYDFFEEITSKLYPIYC